jgi:hypothetical protein
MMAFTGSHNIDKYILPLFLDIKTVATLLNSSGYFKNLIRFCKKIMKNNFEYVPDNKLDRLCKNGINGYGNPILQEKFTLLHYMCSNHHYECAKLLIESGANVNARTRYGTSPLIIACYKIKNKNIIELLLEHNADIDIMDNTGRKALFSLYYGLSCADGIEQCMINECIFMINECILSLKKKMKMIQNNIPLV